jgi:[ribosomal protein S18]-alanine N-acetyltransferase
MTIRPASTADLESIALIQAACRGASQWPPHEYLSFDAQVAVIHERVTGFLVTRTVGDETEILNLAVAPAFQRRGIASALLAQAPGEHIFLEVRASNSEAISLYRKLGFQLRGTRLNYYQNPQEHGLVMALKRKLGHVNVELSRADQDKA